MKRYKLLKDIPFVKAGEIFGLHRGGIKDCITLFKGDEEVYTIKVGENVSEMFDEWFEEVKEPELPKEFFCIDIDKVISYNHYLFQSSESLRQEYIRFMEKYKSVGNYFKTRKEAEKYLEYLKAKTVIKEDAKGFKPDWDTNKEPKYIEPKYIGSYGGLPEKPTLNWNVIYTYTYSTICFRTLEDIMDSFKKHPDEWKAYLTYEQ